MMTGRPITPEDLAELLGESRRWVMRNLHRFPHYRLSRKEVRFKPEHVEEILASIERRPKVDLDHIPGLTKRSRAHLKNAGGAR